MLPFNYQSRTLFSSLQIQSSSLLNISGGINSVLSTAVADVVEANKIGNANPNLSAIYSVIADDVRRGIQPREIEDSSNKILNTNSTMSHNVAEKSKAWAHCSIGDTVAAVTSNGKQNHGVSLNNSNDLLSSPSSGDRSPNSSILEECRKRKILPVNEKLNSDEKKQKDHETEREEDADLGLEKLFCAEQENSTNKGNKKFKKKTIRPNFFLSIRVNNKKIHKKVEEIHKHIQSKNNLLKHTFVSVPTLHLTLFVMTLKDSNDKQKAIDALNLSTGEISGIIEKFDNKIIQFKGLNTFEGQVVFIDTKDSCADNNGIKFIEEVVEVFHSSFRELNLDFKDEKFVPHVTIMKTSKCQKILRKSGIKRISEKHYEKYKDVKFGCQEITCVELCSMNDKKGSDGFYKVLAKVNIKNAAEMVLSRSNDDFSAADLSSYDIIPHWSKELKDFQLSSSWHNVTEEEILKSKQANSTEEKEKG